jgi:DNA polymerase-3 subunit delta'
MIWPDQPSSLAWLRSQGVPPAQAGVMLRAAGGRPQDALQFAPICDLWGLLPKAVQRGDVGVFKDWTPAQTLDALHKLCHDLLATKVGAEPCFFEADELPRGGTWQSLTHWAKALSEARRTVEHPFNPGLMQEALVSQAQLALRPI